ncbi:DUF1833 family protein [Xanthomonas maliensis]|uniref:DUF1833 family protein n=1 Tax=Xanthomonas maliensis TaxID=1321368 RepID=UPI0003A20D1F|nr:DUF1833 family protein [Xanthomonas maliensis]KAB7769366.1 DUF1833 domain-containing protein [Xanthomonas maliensis]
MSFTENRQRLTDPSGVLLFLEVRAPSFTDVLRLVNDTQNWVSNGVEYIGVPFGIKLPDDTAGQTPRTVLTIDNVGRGITEDLEALQPNELVTAKLMIADTEAPSVIVQTWFLPMTHVSVNPTTATAQCGVDFLMRQQAVLLRYTPFLTPGVHS